MIKFRAKAFSAQTAKQLIKKGWSKYKSEMPAILSTGSLALSTAYFLQGRAKKKGDEEYQIRQIEAMNDLTNKLNKTSSALNDVNSSMKKAIDNKEPQEKKDRGIFYKLKGSFNNKKD